MIVSELRKITESVSSSNTNNFVKLSAIKNREIFIYPKSIDNYNDSVFFIGIEKNEKSLFIVSKNNESKILNSFVGEIIFTEEDGGIIKAYPQIHSNVCELQKLFKYTIPILLGYSNSFGFGDRIGLANHAHIRSLRGSSFKPILAQQSIRELTRTKRSPNDVMDAAVWAVFQEGYRDGFGSDADHLKTTDDIDLMIKAGFTMFTFDPSEFVINEADTLNISELENKLVNLNWKILSNSSKDLVSRYYNTKFDLGEDLIIQPTHEEVLRASVKYGNAVAHIKYLYDYLNNTYSKLPFEVEISVDETESVTTPFEHFFIASELNRLGVKIISLAPRFIGDFEKGIDYKGDLKVFKEEYLKHLKISEYFGSYKISLHSGSDKFGVYKTIGSLKRGYTHVKTAGTSYLEAIKVVAFADPDEFRKILDFSRIEYVKEKESYHVSANVEKVHPSENYTNQELLNLFDQNDARQVMHVTFGKVLTAEDEFGNLLFKDKIYNCLKTNEEIHYNYLIKHFKNHLNPFES